MKVSEINESIIGRKVSCIENGARVTGTITAISEDKYSVYVHVKFDEPLHCWSGDYNIEEWWETEYKSWARKFDGWGNLQHMYFVDTLDWLKDYYPKNKHFTDKFEMAEIADNLGLKKASREELQQTRDNVVEFFDKLIDDAIDRGDYEKKWFHTIALSSVTAVIDHYKWNAGMEV